MKRFYISLLVIVGVMITAAWIHYSIGNNTQALISSLDNLYEIASYADEVTLTEETQLLANQWRKTEKFLKCVTSNTHIEAAKRCIDLLHIYTSEANRSAYRQACFDAKDAIVTIKDNEIVKKENIF